MANTSNASQPLKGMINDLGTLNSSAESYSFALNAIKEDKSGNGGLLQNEMSNHCYVQFPPDYQVVGFVNVPEQHRTIYALVNTKTNNSQIGEVIDCHFIDTTDKVGKSSCTTCPEYTAIEKTPLEKLTETCYCTYRIIVSDPCLNFNVNYPVDIEYKITNCSLNIYFTDNLNERRYMYLDYTDITNLESPLKLQDTFKIVIGADAGGNCSCPDGYTYIAETDKCKKVVFTPIDPSTDLRTTCHATDNSYTNFGIAIYDDFSVNGTGTHNVYHVTDTYWSNPAANTTDGVLNRTAIWACGEGGVPQTSGYMQPINEYIGFIFPVDLTETKTYYVGIAGDNAVRIRLDCTTIVDMDPTAVSDTFPNIAQAVTFKYWHVYPVTIPAGHHVIELTGINYGSVAGFGAQIYNNTKQELINSVNGAGLDILFSTSDFFGKQLQVSDTFSGTCPDGSCMDIDINGKLACTSISITDPICDYCSQNIITDKLDCNAIKFHPDYARPCITFKEFVNGGNLKEGTYQILAAYADSFGNPIVDYLPATATIPLFENPIEFETNLTTNKALSFEITNLRQDGIFKYYNIVIAQTINQFTEFILAGTFDTTQNSYVYTGFEKDLRKLAPTEVFFKYPYYPYAKSVTSSNDYLFFGGVKEYPLLNLQPVANEINLQWETVALKEKAYADPKNTFYFHTYQRDEVYAFGIVFEFDNGRDTCAFHIPGRKATTNDLELISTTNPDYIAPSTCVEDNCCEEPVTLAIDGTISVDCNDDGCTQQGQTRVTFTFAEPTPTQLNLQVGQIWQNTDGGQYDGNGTEIFTPPQPFQNIYYGSIGKSDKTFNFTIPAGITSIIFDRPIQLEDYATDPTDRPWICHTCAFPQKFLYIKPQDGVTTNFTNDQNITVVNVPSAQPTPPADPTCKDCSPKRWQVYNTATVVGGDHAYNEDCEIDKCWEYGDFAYWESTELYPNNRAIWGDLCGTPIRHHKFPDSCVSHIHDGTGTDRPYSDNNYVFPIGVRVDHQSVLNALANAVTNGLITQAQRDSIKSYRIVRGNRVGNKSIDAKGLLFNMFKYNKFNQDYYFPNYAYNDLSSDDFLDGVSLATQRYTFHSPDVHFVNSALGNILKVETEEFGKTDSYFTHSECQARQKFLSSFARALAFGLGTAAALSATGEKQCTVITYKANLITDPYNVTSSGTANPGSFTGALAGLAGGAIHLTGTPGSASWSGRSNVPKIITEQNNTQYDTYDPETGATISHGSGDAADRQITTCKGQTFQIFNSDSSIGGAIGGFINDILGLGNEIIQRLFLGLHEMQKVIDTMMALIPYKNYSIQQNSVGKYNNYICVPEGNKLRKLDKTAYLEPIIQEVDEVTDLQNSIFSTIKINNWQRERSVYLKTATTLADPTHIDSSKVSMSALDFNIHDLDKHFNRDISSYYVSIKRNVLNQYGQICNINYLETSPCSFYLDQVYTICGAKVFGGDTFINRFALKRKMPFFQHTMCNMPDDSDVLYNELANVATPKYYFNTAQTLGERLANADNIFNVAGAIIGVNEKNYDVQSDSLFNQNGYIHLFNYGIPYFLVESDINVDYRHGQNNKERDFYPHNTDLKQWLEEANVPISEDNTYFYNRTYSKQNTESSLCTSCISDLTQLTCQTPRYNRAIYSEPSSTEEKNDNWLIFKANNYHDFPLKLGKLISVDGIENDKVLVRLEKGTQMFPAYNTIQATEQNIQVGTGGMFRSNPQDIATTTLGYAGTQHRDIKHTEFGHIWVNAEQGNIFNLGNGGSGMDELSRYGNKNWFRENLPFQIRRDFPNIPVEDIDNNLNGIGLHYCFDKRFNRLLITKLDYKKINPAVTYNVETKTFCAKNSQGVSTPVKLTDTNHFCNKSWTISYDFETKQWVSFHTYTPNFYVEHIDTFESSFTKLGTQSTYMHNVSNKSYQVFYGKLQPFIVETLIKQAGVNLLNSISFNLDVIRYHNEFDQFYSNTKTFNKAIVYNNHQTSGWLNLIVNNPDNLMDSQSYPKRSSIGYDVLVTNSEGNWQFNDFFDISINQQNNLPLFLYDCNNVNKQLNLKAVDYNKIDTKKQPLRQNAARVRFVNDVDSNHHFIFNFQQNNQIQSFR